MPYSNDPLNKPADQVRFLVGDTSTSPSLTDSEIAFLLHEANDNALRAAARAAEQLSAKASADADLKRVGPLETRHLKSTSDRYQALARRLWARAGSANSGPYAGGISRTDKARQVANSDRVRPAFSRRMQEYRGGSVAGGANNNEEAALLSDWPPETQP